MSATTKNTVAVHSSSSECMNCGANYLGGVECKACGTGLRYAASARIHPNAESLVTDFAEENELAGGFGGWTDGYFGGRISPTEF